MTNIEAQNLGKLFSRSANQMVKDTRRIALRSLLGLTTELSATSEENFWPFKGVSFSVERGETLGIIGRNGAGKTTLLNVLAGRLRHDKGDLVIKGRVNNMISVSNGMSDKLSGRDNIRIKADRMGVSASDFSQLEEKVIEFSDLHEFIDMPFGTYSSGMKMRLAFSVNLFVDCDVLLLDEVLAVGDYKFREKCFARMNALQRQCATIMVSHNMAEVNRICDRVMLLDRGCPVAYDEPAKVIPLYLERKEEAGEVYDEKAIILPDLSSPVVNIVRNDSIVQEIETEINVEQEPLTAESPLEIRLKLDVRYPVAKFSWGINIIDESGNRVCSVGSDYNGLLVNNSDTKIESAMRWERLQLSSGDYFVVIFCRSKLSTFYRDIIGKISVRNSRVTKEVGYFHPNINWE